MEVTLARGELSDQRDAAKLNLVLWPKCAALVKTLGNLIRAKKEGPTPVEPKIGRA